MDRKPSDWNTMTMSIGPFMARASTNTLEQPGLQPFPAMDLVRSSSLARSIARILFWMILVFAVACVFVPWQQTSRCDGEVMARDPQQRPQRMLSPAKGVIQYVRPGLIEGTLVEKGELIMALSAFSKDQLILTRSQEIALSSKLESLRNVRENLSSQVALTEEQGTQLIETARQELRAATAKWKQAEHEVESQTANYDQAVRERKSAEQIKGDGISLLKYNDILNTEKSEYAKLEKSRDAEDEAFAEKESKESYMESVRKSVGTRNLQAHEKVSKADSEINTVEKELTDIHVKLGELDRLNVHSPSRGRIHSIAGQVGNTTVKEGDTLFTIVPETDDLAAELTIQGNDIRLIHVGDHVRLQFEGWPAIQFVGWPNAAVGTFGGTVIAINPTDDSKGNFKILVGPSRNSSHSGLESHEGKVSDNPDKESWPDSRYLRQGVRANGWVILKTVPLGFEVWRQINGFPPSTRDDAPGVKEYEPKPVKLK